MTGSANLSTRSSLLIALGAVWLAAGGAGAIALTMMTQDQTLPAFAHLTVVGAKVSSDVARDFPSVVAQTRLSQSQPVGVTISYRSAKPGDFVDISLWRDGVQSWSCQTYTLTATPAGIYYCQWPHVAPGDYEARIAFNGGAPAAVSAFTVTPK